MSANTLAGGLAFDKIQELMGKGRLVGVYPRCTQEFVDSDDPGVDVQEAWPMEFGKKNATTLYQGFRSVVTKDDELAKTILVKQDDGHVYLMHTGRIAVMKEKNGG